MILLYLLISYISRCYFRRREVLTAVIKKKKKSPECGAITSNLPVLDQLQQLQFYDPQIDVVFVSHLHSLPFYVLTFTSDSSLMMFIKCLRVRNWPERSSHSGVDRTESMGNSQSESVGKIGEKKKLFQCWSIDIFEYQYIEILQYFCFTTLYQYSTAVLLLLLAVQYSKASLWLALLIMFFFLFTWQYQCWLAEGSAFRILLSV